MDDKIQKSIASNLGCRFEEQLFSAALDNFQTPNSLRFNNFAYAIRELFRHVLYRLAPDDDVIQCEWYKAPKDRDSKITREDRMRFAIQGGISKYYFTTKLKMDISATLRNIKVMMDMLSSFTHIQPHTFGMLEDDAISNRNRCLSAIDSLFREIKECRLRVSSEISESIQRHLDNKFFEDSIPQFESLSTHYAIDEVYIHEIEIECIGPKSLDVAFVGHVICEHQFGSDSDLKHDLGALNYEKYQIHGCVSVELRKPLGKYASVKTLNIDTQDSDREIDEC